MTSVDDIPPPIIQIGPANQTLQRGSVAMLPCRASGIPIPRVKWYKDGSPLQTGQRFMIVQSGSLKIDGKIILKLLLIATAYTNILFLIDLQLADSGLYTCTASSESGETSWSASLTVS